jgi:hypothetical protein
MKIIGFDIGGANIKASLINNSQIVENFIKYYPIWTKDVDQLPNIINEIKNNIITGKKLNAVAVSMTAELSDAFYTKREGILTIANSFEEIFNDNVENLYFLNIFGEFIKLYELKKDPIQVAAANWAATAKYIGINHENCILIDTGSTTTDIIPILNGIPLSYGKNDTDRLLSGELVYTGALRTEIPSITHKVPYKEQLCRISSEKFALSADIHLVLNHITAEDYTSDTADGREKSSEHALARIARIICSDIEILTRDEIINIAEYIYFKQIEQIKSGLKEVTDSLDYKDILKLPIIVTGLGSDFLARKAAEDIGFKKIINLDEKFGKKGGIVAPSTAIALLLEKKLQEA